MQSEQKLLTPLLSWSLHIVRRPLSYEEYIGMYVEYLWISI